MAYSKKQLPSIIGAFFKEYTRTSRRQGDPNDRHYDKKLEEIIKRMKPEELSRLINYEDEFDMDDRGHKAKKARAKAKFLAVKTAIDSWNPYGLLPDAPDDEFDGESLMVASRIKGFGNVMDIAKIVSDVFTTQFEEKYFQVVDCIDVAETIYRNLSEGHPK